MRRAWPALCGGLALATLAGCGGGDPSGPASAGAAGPGVHGVLRDEAGAPLADAEVLACQATTCQFGTTDADGRFSFLIDAPADVAIKTREDLDAVPRRGAALYPVRVVGSASADLDDVHVPILPEGAPLAPVERDPQTLAAGDGLELTLRRGDLASPVHVPREVAARAVPLDRAPALPALAGEKVVAVFALHPFAATSASPIAVRVATRLAPGTAVRIRTISELDGTLSEPVPGRSDGAAVSSDPGTGIHELTWLVITTG